MSDLIARKQWLVVPALALAFAAAAVLMGGCKTTPEPADDGPSPMPLSDAADVSEPDEADEAAAAVEADHAAYCANPPKSKRCCKAMTEQCIGCARDAKLEVEMWRTRCKAPAMQPKFDCSHRPDGKCCASMSPECIQCGKDGKAEMAEWESYCQPLDAPVDCANRPMRACCMAMTEECLRCVDLGRREMSQWESSCVKAEPPAPTPGSPTVTP